MFTHLVEHEIVLQHGVTEVKTKPYPLHGVSLDIMRNVLKGDIQMGIIQETHGSPFNSPVILAEKKSSGVYRLVGSFVALNRVTIDVSEFKMPDTMDTIDRAGRRKFGSTLDVKFGFNQIRGKKESRRLTAFSIPGLGQYEYV